MKKFIVGAALLSTSIYAYSFDEMSASKLARNYSELVACQITEAEYQKNQYKSIQIKEGMDKPDGYGAMYIVYWEGDVGCQGGAGTIYPNFTIIERSGFSSADPVVVNRDFPEIDLLHATEISGKIGEIRIKGLTNTGTDLPPQNPTKEVSYTITFEDDQFHLQQSN